jgi:hypothetical protein
MVKFNHCISLFNITNGKKSLHDINLIYHISKVAIEQEMLIAIKQHKWICKHHVQSRMEITSIFIYIRKSDKDENKYNIRFIKK